MGQNGYLCDYMYLERWYCSGSRYRFKINKRATAYRQLSIGR
jgi:hypothetical protein